MILNISKYLLLLLVSLTTIHDVRGGSYGDLDTLVTSLFSNYSVQLRPFVNYRTPTYVYMGLWLVSIQELDELDQSLMFTAFLYLHWKDRRLTWSPGDHNRIQFFAYPQKYVWVPDISIINSMETLKELGFDRNYLHVVAAGWVLWIPGGVFRTSCDIDVTYYPFDTQVCSIIFSTLVSFTEEVYIMSDTNESLLLDRYTQSGTWDLLSFTVNDSFDDSSRRSVVKFNLKMKRRTAYYVITIIIPVLFLSLTATLVFALPVDSGEKMGTSITVLLAFAVYLSIVSDQMPKTSSTVSILSLYLSVLLGQTALGVVLSVWILNLHFRDDQHHPPSPLTRATAFHMQRLVCKRPWKSGVVTPADQSTRSAFLEEHCDWDSISTITTVASQRLQDDKHFSKTTTTTTMDTNNATSTSFRAFDVTPSSPEMMSWKEVALTFDRFLFYTFSVNLVMATIICLGALLIGPQQ